MATANKNKSAQSSTVVVKNLSHLEGRIHFPEKLRKANEILAKLNFPKWEDSD